jgi:hypothetical protein
MIRHPAKEPIERFAQLPTSDGLRYKCGSLRRSPRVQKIAAYSGTLAVRFGYRQRRAH